MALTNTFSKKIGNNSLQKYGIAQPTGESTFVDMTSEDSNSVSIDSSDNDIDIDLDDL